MCCWQIIRKKYETRYFLHLLNQWRKKSDPKLDPDPDPLVRDKDPHQNVTDLQHCFPQGKTVVDQVCKTEKKKYHQYFCVHLYKKKDWNRNFGAILRIFSKTEKLSRFYILSLYLYSTVHSKPYALCLSLNCQNNLTNRKVKRLACLPYITTEEFKSWRNCGVGILDCSGGTINIFSIYLMENCT